MKKMLVMIIVLILTALCGCSSFNDKEYFYIEDYSPEEIEVSYQEKSVIESYTELTNAINSMIQNSQDSAQLQFNGYAGNISDDIAEVCWKVKSETALGSFMVDYISYDISRIVTYYQATIYINYKRSSEDLQAIQDIGANKIEETVMQAVADKEDEVIIAVHTDVIDASAMANRVSLALLNVGANSPVIPNVTVDMYTGTSMQRIFDIQLDYGVKKVDLEAMQSKLSDAVSTYSGVVSTGDDYRVSVVAAGIVSSRAVYNAEATAGTAYDALVLGSGDSRAFAVAYSAIANACGLESVVVSGLRDDEPYYWNMVSIDDVWYHIDVVSAKKEGNSVVPLTDAEMINNYRWDELSYPSCDGNSFVSRAISEEN